MDERDRLDNRPTQPVDAPSAARDGAAPGRYPKATSDEPGAPLWAVPSSSNTSASSGAGDSAGPAPDESLFEPGSSGPSRIGGAETPLSDDLAASSVGSVNGSASAGMPAGMSPGMSAGMSPGISAGMLTGMPLRRRKGLVGAAGAAAALLLVAGGFLAGTQFGHGQSDRTRLVADQSGPVGGGNGAPFGQGGQGGQGGPGGQSGPSGHGPDGVGPGSGQRGQADQGLG